jgi:hypothetical protein
VDSYTFASEIVIPTVKKALSDRGNRRRMYVASIVTYSLVDYIAAEVGIEKSDVCNSLRKVCKPAFDVVQGVCHGTKHAGNKQGFLFKPGNDRDVPVSAFDVPGVGWGHGRIGCPWPQCSEGRRRAILGYLFAGCATHLMRHLQNSTRKYRSLVSGQNSFRGQTNLKLDSIRLFGAVGVTDTSPLFPQEPPFFAVPITKFFCLPLVVQLLSAGERDLDFRPALFVKIDF